MARTGWQPEDVAASHPRHKNDLSTFEKYDPQVPGLVAWYGFFQLVAVVLFLIWMQVQTLPYWGGVFCWTALFATTMTTALWLEGRESTWIMQWERLRKAGIAGLVICGLTLGVDVVLIGLMYLLANILFLWVMARGISPAVAEQG